MRVCANWTKERTPPTSHYIYRTTMYTLFLMGLNWKDSWLIAPSSRNKTWQPLPRLSSHKNIASFIFYFSFVLLLLFFFSSAEISLALPSKRRYSKRAEMSANTRKNDYLEEVKEDIKPLRLYNLRLYKWYQQVFVPYSFILMCIDAFCWFRYLSLQTIEATCLHENSY